MVEVPPSGGGNIENSVAPIASVAPGTIQPKAGKQSNRGCWIVAALGCGLVILLVGCIVAAFVFLVAASSDIGGSVSENVLFEGSGGKIAVINIDGAISETDSSGSLLTTSGVTPHTVNEQLDKALADDSVKGVLLKINSPGGEAVASDLIYRKVKEVSDKKPIVSWISSVGASGGYMIAVASDKIFSHPNGITGSIGVILQATDLSGLYEKLGIKNRVFKSGRFKDDAEIFDENSDGEAAEILQTLITENYDDFVALVAENRDMTVAQVKELADGRIYSGKQAAKNGLIDETGYFEDAISALEDMTGEENLTVVEYSYGGFWEGVYKYEKVLFGVLGFVTSPEPVGMKMYYIMDI